MVEKLTIYILLNHNLLLFFAQHESEQQYKINEQKKVNYTPHKNSSHLTTSEGRIDGECSKTQNLQNTQRAAGVLSYSNMVWLDTMNESQAISRQQHYWRDVSASVFQ